jgi:hypothetical protein
MPLCPPQTPCCPDENPCRRDGKLASNHLRYGTARAVTKLEQQKIVSFGFFGHKHRPVSYLKQRSGGWILPPSSGIKSIHLCLSPDIVSNCINITMSRTSKYYQK